MTKSSTRTSESREALLDAAGRCLRDGGFTGLSTRRVAELAGTPLSQIHYHFGSKEALVLALLDRENTRLLERQQAMFASGASLSERWARACDYLDDDLESGYVRVLAEMISAGWCNPGIAAAVRRQLQGWYTLLEDIAREAAGRFGGLGPFDAADISALVGNAFIGSEALLLLGFEQQGMPIRRALRRVGDAIRALEAPSANQPGKAQRRARA
jgi:AcrR family transcriptional regulator